MKRLVSDVMYGELPASEWERLRIAYEECRAEDPVPLDPRYAVVIAAETQGRLVGCVAAEKTWQVSPIWIERQFRGSDMGMRLAQEIKRFNTEGLPELLLTTNPHVEMLVHRLGFIPVPGTFWRRTSER